MNKKDVIKTSTLCLKRGWQSVLINKGGKAPAFQDWKEKPMDSKTVHDYLQKDDSEFNIGVILGGASGGLVDIDLDCPEALYLAPRWLPQTQAVFGRGKRPSSHWLYYTNGGSASRKFGKTSAEIVIEIRGDNNQTILPGSWREDDNDYVRWEKGLDREPLRMEYETLFRRVAIIASIIVVSDEWPEGSRHEASLALAGTLLRLGLDKEEVKDFIADVCYLTGDEEAKDRIRAANNTAEKFEKDGKVTGSIRLYDFISKDVVNKVRTWLGEDEMDRRLEEYNAAFFATLIGSKFRIGMEDDEDGLQFVTKGDFVNYNLADVLWVPQGEGKQDKAVSMAEIWLRSEQRRTYRNVGFYPGTLAPPSVYNLFQGWPVPPKKGPLPDIFFDHVLNNICDGDEMLNDWVLSFFADIFQNPSDRPGTSLVLRGARGTGKNTVIDLVGSLLGPYYRAVSSSRYLISNFNAHMSRCLLIGAHEAFFAGDKAGASVLKSLITDQLMQVEFKGIDPVQMPCHLRIAMSSNEDWVTPAGPHERRFCVIDVTKRRMQDIDYFNELYDTFAERQNAMVDFFMEYKVDRKKLRQPPKTSALHDQQQLSMTAVERWWTNKLLGGSILDNDDFNFSVLERYEDGWPKKFVKDDLFSQYVEEMASTHIYRDMSNSTKFWIEMRRLLPSFRQLRLTRDKVKALVLEISPYEECVAKAIDTLSLPPSYFEVEKDETSEPSKKAGKGLSDLEF